MKITKWLEERSGEKTYSNLVSVQRSGRGKTPLLILKEKNKKANWLF
jgi:hypothetical protein